MNDSIQDRVFDFVAEETNVRRETLTLNTTLSGDIGLDGDDAVKFLEAFRQKFSVDIEDLQLVWDRYFAPEGLTLSTGLLFGIPCLVLGVLLTRLFPRLWDWICFTLAAVLWLVTLSLVSRWRNRKRTSQIAIQDLVDSAKSGRWAKVSPTMDTPGTVAGARDAGTR